MIREQFVLIVKYWKLKSYLVDVLKYDELTARKTIAEIRKMDQEVLHEFLVWFNSDSEEAPDMSCNGVSLRDIVEIRNTDIVSAFVDLNWIKNDPARAKYVIRKPLDHMQVTEADKDIIRRIARKKNWDLKEELESSEDVSDVKVSSEKIKDE